MKSLSFRALTIANTNHIIYLYLILFTWLCIFKSLCISLILISLAISYILCIVTVHTYIKFNASISLRKEVLIYFLSWCNSLHLDTSLNSILEFVDCPSIKLFVTCIVWFFNMAWGQDPITTQLLKIMNIKDKWT